MIPDGIPFTMVNSCQIPSSDKIPNTLVHPIKVKLPAPHFITFRRRNIDMTVYKIIPFYIQKALDAIAGKVNNTFCLENGTLPIQAFSNKQADTSKDGSSWILPRAG
jgi:hypothetical protein